ncbi:hypothetical protein [Shewanella surugensis]|uniref:Galactose oxidase n=1 Tax=Shewanella surugensis TaxID=212020 RepID=A0ABT0LIU2_9GAMM|nr:hypothetical protein [Shewanella surugensis]MCL1127613.1 hypothetical protein [Shewanella surugensis]
MLRLANIYQVLFLCMLFNMVGCSDSTSGEFGSFTTSTPDTEQNSLTVKSILIQNNSSENAHILYFNLESEANHSQYELSFSFTSGDQFPDSCFIGHNASVILASDGNCFLYIKSDAGVDVGEYSLAELVLSDGDGNRVNYQLTAQNVLYVGGSFTYLNQGTDINLANWDGSEWQQLGDFGTDSSESCNGTGNDLGLIYSLVLNDTTGNLFAAGCMTEVDNTLVNYIAQWNGEAWRSLKSELPYEVRSLVWDPNNEALFVAGGSNALVNEASINNAAETKEAVAESSTEDSAFGYLYQWQHAVWVNIGSLSNSPINAQVTSLALDENNHNLYFGGKFTGYIHERQANRIAMWSIDDQAWSVLGTGVDDTVNGLFFNAYTDTLFVGGFFYPGIITWDSTLATWVEVGVACRVGSPPCDGDSDSSDNANVVGYLAMDEYNMFIGGNFTSVADESDLSTEIAAEGLAQFNTAGDSWSAIANSPPVESGFVKPLIYVENNNILYAAGSFTITENVDSPIYNIGKWDISSSEWQPLSTTEAGLDGEIETMVMVSKQASPELVEE